MSTERFLNLRIGTDVGGTFTDVVAVNDAGQLFYAKTPSTPRDQSLGVLAGLNEMLEVVGAPPEAVKRLAHGTTVATNSLLERTGARTALLVTEGFRDVLHIGRQTRPDLYDLKASRPAPLVPRRFRREVSERVRHTGRVEKPVAEEQLRTIVAELLDSNVESIAICFLHAYANPENEKTAAQVVRAAAPDAPVSASHEILSEFREFERMNTTVLNAYVHPIMAGYIRRLIDRVREADVHAPVLVMQSSGGMMRADKAAERSVHTLLSGPAGGVLGAAYLAELAGYSNCITADVGGTSFDVSTVMGGKPTIHTEGVIEGYPVKFPHIDIHTIGAGGGSIAWIDKGGALRVGPRSAGADPGPVSYNQDGTEPTVTDAHVVLGRLGGRGLLGGALELDVDAAREALRTKIAEPIGISVEEAAEGILSVTNAAMVRAIRVMTVERGQDPRQFILMPYGGAGPLHAVDLARQLNVKQVLVPVAPGNFSALGLLVAPVRYDAVQTYQAHGDQIDLEYLAEVYDRLQSEVAERLSDEGFSAEHSQFIRQADLRYYGQAYELTVDVPNGRVGEQTWQQIEERYHQAHEQAYGFSKMTDPVELVNLRVSGVAEFERVGLRGSDSVDLPQADATPSDQQPVFFNDAWVDTPIYDRENLQPGHKLEGPAIVRERGSTTALRAGDQAVVDPFGSLLITVQS